jgi:RNA polymerase sigma factor (TIGR02999 family)
MSDSPDITLLLRQAGEGKENAPDELLNAVYEELRRLASAYMRRERSDHTLQPTALVHEAYVQLVGWKNVNWQNRAHFFAVAARIMRQVLIEHARQKSSVKRGGSWQKIVFNEAISFSGQDVKEFDLLEINDAINALAEFDKRQARIVELKFFGGLTDEETGEALGVSSKTVQREWTLAKAWLRRRLKGCDKNDRLN